MSRTQGYPAGLPATVLVFLLVWAGQARGAKVDIGDELERLMEIHNFTMRSGDIDATRGVQGRGEGSELVQRLRTLLAGFDHIIVQRTGGGVERLLILGEKAAYVPPEPDAAAKQDTEADAQAKEQGEVAGEIVLETKRQGASHVATLGLEGGNGKRVQRVLLVDTGADYVVLPLSLITSLGISPNDLKAQLVQTANGKVEAKLSKLARVWVGERKIEDVDVAFIEDGQLGGNGLLGMSVLGRFRVTIDDEQNRVVLTDK